MLLADMLLLAASALACVALGMMLFFAAVVTPTAFTALDRDAAGRFLRAVFPRYDLVLATLCALSAALAVSGLGAAAPEDGGKPMWPVPVVLGLAALGFLASRQVLTPRIDRQRAAMLEGDVAAGQAFRSLHRGSVMLNVAQMLGLAAAAGWTLFG